MQGTITDINFNTLRAAILTDEGFTIADFESPEINIGDVISGDLNDVGDQNLINQTSGHKVYARVEATMAGSKSAQILLWGNFHHP